MPASAEVTTYADEPSTRPGVALVVVAVVVALVSVATTNLSALSALGLGPYPLTYDDIALPRLVIVMVGLAVAWTAWFLESRRTGEPMRITPAFGLLGALAVWGAVSAAFSPHRALAVLGQSERLEGVVMLVCYALLYGVALQVVRGARDARVLGVVLAVVTVLLSAYGVLQTARLDPTKYLISGEAFSLDKAFATFGNPNFFAGFLVLAAPVVVAQVLLARSRKAAAAWGVATLVVAAALIFSVTRGAWVAAFVESLIFAAVFWGRRWAVNTTAKTAIVAVVVALTLLAGFSLFYNPEQTGPRDRVLIAGVAISAALKHPVVGYGPDSFLAAFRANRSNTMASRFGADFTMNNAHNWPLQFAATLGIPGALLLIAAFVAGLWRPRRLLGRSGEDDPDLTLIAMYVGCIGFLIHMMFNVAVIGATAPFWVMLGAVGASSAATVRLGRRWSTAGAIAGVAATVVALVVSGVLLAADSAFLQSRIAFRSRDLAGARVWAVRAVQLNPLSVKYRRGLADVAITRTQTAIVSHGTPADVKALYGFAEPDIAAVLRLDPADYPTLAWKAGIQGAVAAYTGDTGLVRLAAESAQQAALLDAQHAQVVAVARGDTSDSAVRSAMEVPPLP